MTCTSRKKPQQYLGSGTLSLFFSGIAKRHLNIPLFITYSLPCGPNLDLYLTLNYGETEQSNFRNNDLKLACFKPGVQGSLAHGLDAEHSLQQGAPRGKRLLILSDVAVQLQHLPLQKDLEQENQSREESVFSLCVIKVCGCM